jgi:foldase protein PrsA
LTHRPGLKSTIALAVVLTLGLSACGGSEKKVPAGSVATVQDTPISQPEFVHWLNVVAASQQQQTPGSKRRKPPKPPKPGSAQYKQLSTQVMQFLVSAKWIAGEAGDRGLQASPPEVKKTFEQTRDQSFPSKKAYERFLKTSGQTQSDIDFRVRSDVLATKVRTEVTKDTGNVSDDDVKSYYEKNQQQFSQPERRDVQVVLTKTEDKAREALKRIQGGEKFDKVVKELSTDPTTKQQGGRLLGVAKGQQEKSLDDAIFTAQKGQLVGPVKTQRGYYALRVGKITPPSKQGLDQSKEGIRQLLISQQQQQSLDAFTQGFRKKWRARTTCAKGFVIPDCSNGKEPPAAPGTVGPPAKTGAGSPPAQGGGQVQAPPSGIAGAAGGAPSTGTGPPGAGTGGGSPPALGGAAAPAGGIPGGVQQGVPQGTVPQQGAPPGGG